MLRILVCGGLATLAWAAVLLGDGSDQFIILMLLLGGAAITVAVLSRLPKFTLPKIEKKQKSGDIEVAEVGGEPLQILNIINKLRFFQDFRRKYTLHLIELAKGIGEARDVFVLVSLWLKIGTIMIAPMVGGGIALALLIPDMPYLAALGLVSIIPFAVPLLTIKSAIKDHAKRVEEEMAFFLCYVNIMQGVGYSLYKIFETILKKPDVFVAMSRDAMDITKRVIMLGKTQTQSMKEYADYHPQQEFCDFLNGYISKQDVVGDTPKYTEEKAGQFFDKYEGVWERYKETVSSLFMVAFMVVIFLPMMIMMTALIGSEETTPLLILMGTIIAPTFAMVILLMISAAQPTIGIKMKTKMWIIAPGVATFLIMNVLFGILELDTNFGIIIAASALTVAAVNTFLMREKLADSKNIDKMLPEFLRDISELTSAGMGVNDIIIKQANRRAYSGKFGNIIERLAIRLSAGEPLARAVSKVDIESKYLDFMLFILVSLKYAGSTSSNHLQKMNSFMFRIVHIKNETTKSLNSTSMIIYAMPFIMVGMVYGMFAMMTSGALPDDFAGVEIPFAPASPDSGTQENLGAMVAAVMIPMGLISAKVRSFTVLDSKPLLLISLLTILALIVIPMIIEVAM